MEKSEGIINTCKWKVYKGSCLEIMKNMIKENEFVDCIVTSPPYFDRRAYGAKPKKDGHMADWLYTKRGQAIEGEIGNGKDKSKYLNDIKEVLNLCFKVLKEKKFLFINISTCHENFELLDFSSKFIEAAKEAGFIHWDTIIWIKRNPMPPGRHKNIYLGQGWEYILAFAKGKNIEINSEALKIKTHFKCISCNADNYIESSITPNYMYSNIGCYGRKYNSIMSHPALFPLDVPEYCMSISSKKGDLIFDPFVGSGTSLIAGLEQGLNVIGCELVPQIYKSLVEGMMKINTI